MSTDFPFDVAEFRKSLISTFESLNDDELMQCVRAGVQDAFQSRLSDLVKYEFTKLVHERMIKEKAELFSADQLPAKADSDLVKTNLRSIARQYAQEVINRSIR